METNIDDIEKIFALMTTYQINHFVGCGMDITKTRHIDKTEQERILDKQNMLIKGVVGR